LRDELALELSAGKTLITHARTQAARFLGYEISAPRGALAYRPRSGHRLEEVSVGLMAYLDP
jgi:hypothetical protein